jgi:hypothetical protein
MYVETIGTPFATGVPLDGMAFARDVAAAFLSPRLRFTAVRAEAPRPDFRLVWVFDPPDNLQLDTLWSGDARPAPARNAAIVKVAAAFCFEARLYAVARGSVKRPGDATDGPWRQLVHQISRELVN